MQADRRRADPLDRANVAAAEDGRTPLNTYSDSSLGDRARTKRVSSGTKELPVPGERLLLISSAHP